MPLPTNVSELGANLADLCFAYPDHSAGRKHGPVGYNKYESYRDWLRDEFSFRCAYCLMREDWLRGKRGFQIDHCLPQSMDSELTLQYDNLVYTCPWCNRAKSGAPVPNPTQVLYGEALHVDLDGRIIGKNRLGLYLIEGLCLDHLEITRHRQLILRIIHLAEVKNNVEMILKMLGIPNDLPYLKKKRPPNGNSRPEGIEKCWYEKRVRGELALIY